MNISLPKMKNKKVLITGGLGFIGSNLAHKCVELGAKVTIFDCLDPRSGGNLYNVQGIREKVELAFHDILNFAQVSEFVTDKDIVFNCASSTSHAFSMREPWVDLDINSNIYLDDSVYLESEKLELKAILISPNKDKIFLI